MLIGTEDDLWQRLNGGAQGAISALANFIPEEILAMHEKVSRATKPVEGPLAETPAGAGDDQGVRFGRGPEAASRGRHGAPMGTVSPTLRPTPDYDPEPVLSAALSAA